MIISKLRLYVFSLLDNFINEGELVSGEGEYQPVTRWRQTLPYNVAFLLVTAWKPLERACFEVLIKKVNFFTQGVVV